MIGNKKEKMIKLLDCTLRDGGYVNNWLFGSENIGSIIEHLEEANVDIIEVGFLKDEEYNPDRTVFSRIEQASKFLPTKIRRQYAVMVDAMNPYPIELMPNKADSPVSIIRVMIWKTKHNQKNEIVNCIEECFEYCKAIAEKGYELCIQPARVDQYSSEEFVKMVKLFETLNPKAIYIVDSWGTLFSDKILEYARLADEALNNSIAIGFHGHNNMMQAFDTAVQFLSMDVSRDMYIDASIMGIGRGAGNLNLEVIAKYLNEKENMQYNLTPITAAYERFINPIGETCKWGFSYAFFLSAIYNCNPNYVIYLYYEKKHDCNELQEIFSKMIEEDKVMFSKEKADSYTKLIRESKKGNV